MPLLGIGGVTILWIGLTLMMINHSRGANKQSTQAYIWLIHRGWYAYLLYLAFQFGINVKMFSNIYHEIARFIGGIL